MAIEPCSTCGLGPDACACEHDWKPPVPYEDLGYVVRNLVICGKCGVSYTIPIIGPPPQSPMHGVYSPWDGHSSCLSIRQNRIASNQVAAMQALIRESERNDFISSHPEGHYWIACRSGPTNYPFVAYLSSTGYFSSHPNPGDYEDIPSYYWRNVEILGRCEVPGHVQARIDAEFVMYS